MIEGELVIVSIISGIFMIITVSLMQRFWIQKWRMNFDFEKYKEKGRNKRAKMKNPAPKTAVGNAAALLPVLRDLDPDQLKTLANMFLGEEIEEEGGDLIDLLKKIPPDLIQGALEGLRKGGSQGGAGY
jgi:hypothetical protein